ncbi:hypothetical protein AAGS40_30075 (plasmid) [Paraburkholderia sp. PREW-6R]|uniref:hypothetical protein n=1 Tax=Paraburkholderia sp. PREW-6R TaxID=3141544 RepID=UPI0031F4DC67
MKLDGRVAETVGKATYELATNAIKYGALSGKEGIVTVEGATDERNSMFRLTWEETGGPSVEVPQRNGSAHRQLRATLLRVAVLT